MTKRITVVVVVVVVVVVIIIIMIMIGPLLYAIRAVLSKGGINMWKRMEYICCIIDL